VLQATRLAEGALSFTISRARFFDRHGGNLSLRQRKVLNRMFEAGPEVFVGGMTPRKYIALTKVSKATATRDLQHLEMIGALRRSGADRSSSYSLAL